MSPAAPAANASCAPAPHRLGPAWKAVIAAVAVVAVTLAAPAAPASGEVTFNQRMLELVNGVRSGNGLKPLVSDATLAGLAEDAPYNGCGFTVLGRAKDMGVRNYFSHTILGCGTQSVFNLLNSVTGLLYSGAGENIAWMNGTTDPRVAAENLHDQLMKSPSHRANILNPDFTKVGIGSWHTEPGQTWSGGGFALSRVWIGVQLFTGGPVDEGGGTSPPPEPTEPTGRFTPLTPARILDTRTGTGGISGALPPSGTVDVQIAGRGGVPLADVASVAMTVTVTQPTSFGYLTAWPSGTVRPTASNLNFVAGETVSNLVVVKVGANGKVSLFNPVGATHVVVDVAGWYSGSGTGNAGRFQPLVPARILDTRIGTGGGVRLAPGASFDLQVTGRGGVPASGVQAAVMNVTVTGTAADGYTTVYPTGEARPLAANLTFAGGNTVGARTMVKLGAGGKVTIFNGGGATDVVVDISGWYTDSSVAGSTGAFVPLDPARILDTRIGTGGSGGPLAPGGTIQVQVAGRGGVPSSGVRAVVLNATATEPAGPGYVTVFPSGIALPLASDVNYGPGETQPNLVVVQLGIGGEVNVYSPTGTHLIFDVAGWIS